MFPAIQHARELAQVSSLGVDTSALEQLTNEGKRFAEQFGGSATEFVRSAYDIQSSIEGLNGDQLARFTRAANITAKATGATADQMTDFFGTMFGIFREEADRVGKARWVEQLSGQVAQAVKMFKLTGPKIASFFQTLGADATAAGVTMAEQIALAGQLGASMSGEQAGTRVRAFLANVAQAGEKLGMNFADAQGRMLPVAEILGKLRDRFGEIDTLAEKTQLKEAFGSEEAFSFLTAMVKNADKLKASVKDIEAAKGLQRAAEMAQRAVVPFDRLWASVKTLALTISAGLLDALKPVIEAARAWTVQMREWADRVPNLTKLVALGALAVFALAIGFGVLGVAAGILGFVAEGIALVGAALAFLLSPVGLVILGIALLVAGVVAAIWYWDEFKRVVQAVAAWFDGLPFWVKALMNAFLPFISLPLQLIAHWEAFVAAFKWAWAAIKALAKAAVEAIMPILQPFIDGIAAIGEFTGKALGWFGGKLADAFNLGELQARVKAAVENDTSATRTPLAQRSTQGEVAPPEFRGAAQRIMTQDNRRQGGITNFNIRTEKVGMHEIQRFYAIEGQG